MKAALVVLFALLALPAAAQQVRTKIPGGSVVLQPGYQAVPSTKVRAAIKRVEDERGFVSEIGPAVVPRLTAEQFKLCRWSRKTVIDGRQVLMGISKDDDVVTITILGKPADDTFKSANFFGEFDRVEEVGDIILIALSFRPAATR